MKTKFYEVFKYDINKFIEDLVVQCQEHVPVAITEHNKGKTVYLAGKISDLSIEETFWNFKIWELVLKTHGYKIKNPISLKNIGMEYERIMQNCFDMIDDSDAIFLQLNSKNSLGAMRELDYAINKGKEILREENV